MTAAEQTAVDPVWLFVQALPPKARADLNRTDRLVIAIHRAVNEHGWTPQQLAAHCARNLTARNPGGVIQHRLNEIDGPPHDEPSPFGARRPWCSPECRDRSGWLEDADGHAVGRCECRTAGAQ